MAELADYAWLTGDDAAAWLARVAQDARTELQILDSLRRDLPTELARLVVEQVDLRRRADEKFGNLAETMFFTRMHLEQATDIWTARYKAGRMAAYWAIADYCCGIGGDLLAFAERGPAVGWDLSPIACLLAEANVKGRAAVHCADVAQLTLARAGAWHLDPDRRATGRRVTDLTAYAPGPELVMKWLHANLNGQVKLAPATVVPESWSADAELEWISRDRQCRQQVAWLAPLAQYAGRRRATLVQQDHAPVSFIGDGAVACAPAETPLQYLFDPDPSLLAADLLGAFAVANDLQSLGAGGAYLTCDNPFDHPLAAPFAVLDCLPLRPAAIAAYFAERGVGSLEIKKRGVAIDPESLRRRLKLRGDNAATLVLTRIGRREVAIVAQRISE